MTDEIERWRDEIRWLRALALRLVSDPDLADDLAQETALISLSRDRALDEGGRGWRVGVLRRLVLTRWRERSRRERREAKAIPPTEAPAPEALLEQIEVHRALVDAVIALEEPYRQVVILSYFHDLSAAEISRRTGDPEPTIRSRLRRAIARLRESLDRRAGGDRRKWAAPLVAWLALSGGAEGAIAASHRSDVPAAHRGPESHPPSSIGASLMSAKKAILAASALLLLAGVGWYAIDEGRRAEPRRPEGLGIAATSDPAEAVAPAERDSPRSPLAPERRIRGVVLDRHSGRAIAGARVELISPDSERTLGASESRTDGTWSIDVAEPLGASGARVRASASGFLRSEKRYYGDIDRWPDPLPAFHLGPGHVLAGKVVDEAGAPVAGAEVVLWSRISVSDTWRGTIQHTAEESGRIAWTDADGRFVGSAPRGDAVLAAIAPGRSGVAAAHLPLAAGESILISMSEDPGVRGIVLDEHGEPVPGAEISSSILDEAGSGLPSGGSWSPSAVSDAAGAFRLPSLGSALGITVQHPGHFLWPGREELRSNDFEPGSTAEIVLRRGRRILGSCVGWDDTPLAGRPFALQLEGGGSRPGSLGEDGRFEIPCVGLAATSGTLYVGGALPIGVSWSPVGDSIDLGALQLLPGATAEVRIVDSAGRPVERAGVRITQTHASRPWEARAEARTGPDGWASLHGLAEGDAEIIVWAPGADRAAREIAIPAEGIRIEIPLAAHGTLRGRLVDDAGVPLAGARLELEREGDPEVPPIRSEREFPDLPAGLFSEATEEDGLFRFPAVPAGPALLLRITGPGLLPATIPIEPLASAEERDLGDLAPVGAAGLDVEILDPAGRPMPTAIAELHPVGGDKRSIVTIASDREGLVRFRGARPGRHTIRARAENLLPVKRTVDLQPGANRVTIALEPGRVWELLVLDTAGEAVQGASVYVWGFDSASQLAQGTTDEDGRVTLAGLPERLRSFAIDAEGFLDVHEELSSAALPERIVLSPAAGLRILFERPAWGPPLAHGTLRVKRADGSVSSTSLMEGNTPELSSLPPGPAEVQILAAGYASFRTTVEIVAGEVTDVHFRPTAAAESISVRVVDDSGEPHTGAKVRARRREAPPMPTWGGFTPLEHVDEGRYEAAIGEAGSRYDVIAEAPGYAPTVLGDVLLGAEAVITLELPANLELVVLEADGSPAVGKGVMLRPVDLFSVLEEVARQYSEPRSPDAEGRLAFASLTAASYRVYITQAGTTTHSEEVRLSPGETRELSITIPSRVEISGWITRNGERLREGKLLVSTGSGLSQLGIDENGEFRGSVADLPTATFSLTSPDGNRVEFREVSLATRGSIELSFDSTSAELRFVGPDGAPFGPLHGWVRCPGREIDGTASFQAGADGIARIPTLLPGLQSVQVELPPDRILFDNEFETAGAPVTLRIAETRRLRVRFAKGAGKRLYGTLVDAEGRHRSLSSPAADGESGEQVLAVPHAGEASAIVITGAGLAPIVVDLADGVPADPIVLHEMPGGTVALAPFPAARGNPVAVRIEPQGGVPLHPTLARRRWRGERMWAALPVGRWLVAAEGTDGDLGSFVVEVVEGEPATVSW